MYKDRDTNQRDSRFENQQDGFKKNSNFSIFLRESHVNFVILVNILIIRILIFLKSLLPSKVKFYPKELLELLLSIKDAWH